MTSTPWTFTVDDTSSVITYTPHGDGGSGDWTSTGWQPWFSDIGFMPGDRQALYAAGWSQHITAFPEASLSFQFYGTGIALYGNATCSYDITVDDDKTSHDNTYGLLFSDDTLSKATHTLTLTAHASGTNPFSFDRADVHLTDAPPEQTTVLATDADTIHYDTNWSRQTNWQIPSKDNPAPFYQKAPSATSASFSSSFQGSGVALYGARNWGNGIYSVKLDGVETQYNSSTMWLMGDTLMFYQYGLDPSATHALTLTARGSQADFRFNSLVVFTPNGTTTSPIPGASLTSSNLGAPTSVGSVDGQSSPQASSHLVTPGVLAGAVISSIAGVVILAALIWFCVLRRKRRAPEPATDGDSASTTALKPDYIAPAMVQTDLLSPGDTTQSAPLRWHASVSPLSLTAKTSKERLEGHHPRLSPPDSQSSEGSRIRREQSQTPIGTPPMTPSSVPASSSNGGTAAASSVLVERLAQSIAERINRRGDTSLYYDHDIPPPQYQPVAQERGPQ
ncbi:hypothetical protein C8Q74DRAFT_1369127 [Fomes fomentarius]|nr:hypothetical protein C8Q74DRAFT_1369127 [Fomes fomentarius]